MYTFKVDKLGDKTKGAANDLTSAFMTMKQ